MNLYDSIALFIGRLVIGALGAYLFCSITSLAVLAIRALVARRRRPRRVLRLRPITWPEPTTSITRRPRSYEEN